MKYTLLQTTQTLQELATANEHDASYRQLNVKIHDIPDTYLSKNNILTDKGVLIIDYGEDDAETHKHTYSMYYVFEKEASDTFDSVQLVHSGIMSRDPEIETTHRLLLEKFSVTENSKTTYWYRAVPIKLGTNSGCVYYRLDIDRFKYQNIVHTPSGIGLYTYAPIKVDVNENESYFINEIDYVSVFGVPYKEYLYFNVMNSTSTYTIVFDQDKYTAKKIVCKGNNKKSIYYIDIDYTDINEDGIDDNIDVLKGDYTDEYLYFQIKGTVDSPNQIIVEVY